MRCGPVFRRQIGVLVLCEYVLCLCVLACERACVCARICVCGIPKNDKYTGLVCSVQF